MGALSVPTLLDARARRRRLREISESLSRIDSNYFVHDLVNLAKQDNGYVSLMDKVGISDDDIQRYYTELAVNSRRSEILWAAGHYVPASAVYHRSTLFYVHQNFRDGVDSQHTLSACYRYFLSGSKGAVRNVA